MGGIVVGHDESMHAQRAAREAMVLARAHGSPASVLLKAGEAARMVVVRDDEHT